MFLFNLYYFEKIQKKDKNSKIYSISASKYALDLILRKDKLPLFSDVSSTRHFDGLELEDDYEWWIENNVHYCCHHPFYELLVEKDDRIQLTTCESNPSLVRFEVFTAVTMKNGVFWDVTPCGSCKTRRFGGFWCILHQGDKNRWTRNNTSCN
jgi:hypothetical protein